MVMLRWMGIVSLAAFALALALPATAEIRTILEPRLIDEMETVRLTLRVAGTSPDTQPDFSPLEQDFELLGTQTSSRISSINGRTSAVVEYQINLRPRRTGEIQLPRIQVGNDYSEELTLAVRPLDPGVREAIERMIFFESELTIDPVYVQAQTVLIRRLYYSNGVQIYSDLPGAPEVADAVVLQLGDSRSDRVVRDGRRYGVIEQRFAIFPETSGQLTIPSISVTSSVRLQSGGRTRRSGIRVSTEELNIAVLPIPPQYPAGEPWLPAESVAIDAQWSPESSDYEIGEPVSLQLRAVAVGNVGSAIPPLQPGVSEPAFKVYPEAASLEDNTSDEHVIGQRDQSFALIPAQPGEVSIPAVSLTWWDTLANQLRVSEIPSASVTLTGQLPPTAPAMTADGSNLTETPSSDPETVPSPEPSPTLQVDWRQWWPLSVLFLLLLAMGIAYRYLGLPTWAAARLDQRASNKNKLTALSDSAQSGNLRAFRNALSNYLCNCYRCGPAEAFHLFSQNAEAAESLQQLEQALYSPAADAEQFDCSELLSIARRVRPNATQRRDDDSELPTLYS